MLEKLDHIGIAVKDIDQAIKLYKEVFGNRTQPYLRICLYQGKDCLLSVGGGENRVDPAHES